MQIFINGLQTQALEVADDQTVFAVKELLADSEGVPVEDQVLTFAGQPLEDEETLASYGIAALSTISADIRLLGGEEVMYKYMENFSQ